MKKITMVVLCVLFSIFFLSCSNGVSQEEYDALKAENEALKASAGPTITDDKTPVEPDAIDIDNIEGYIEAPVEIYSTPADENGLGDTLMFADGKVSRVVPFADYSEEKGVDIGDVWGAQYMQILFIENESGTIMLVRTSLNDYADDGWDECKEGANIRVWFVYGGFSEVTQTASGDYQYALKEGEDMPSLPNAIDINYGYNLNDSPTISLEEFNKLRTGMEYEEACKIIGSDGELSAQSGDIKIYTFDGDGSIGANASITFVNGKLRSKAQSGLE